MKPIFVATAFLATFSLESAHGQALGGGAEQLARSVGVSATNYTVAELSRMRSALEDGNTAEFKLIRDGVRINAFSTKAEPSAGQIAYAAKLNIDPTSMSFSEMHSLSVARASGRSNNVAAFWTKRDPNNPSRVASYVSPGESMIAAGIGVDPADYTLSELVRMKAAADSQD